LTGWGVARDQGTQWVQRIHAELYQHGIATLQGQIRYEKTRAGLTDPVLAITAAGRQRIAVAYRMIDATTAESKPLKLELTSFGRSQPACRALAETRYGIGGLIAGGHRPDILCDLCGSQTPAGTTMRKKSPAHPPSSRSIVEASTPSLSSMARASTAVDVS
jgi:hypothetical protein